MLPERSRTSSSAALPCGPEPVPVTGSAAASGLPACQPAERLCVPPRTSRPAPSLVTAARSAVSWAGTSAPFGISLRITSWMPANADAVTATPADGTAWAVGAAPRMARIQVFSAARGSPAMLPEWSASAASCAETRSRLTTLTAPAPSGSAVAATAVTSMLWSRRPAATPASAVPSVISDQSRAAAALRRREMCCRHRSSPSRSLTAAGPVAGPRLTKGCCPTIVVH